MFHVLLLSLLGLTPTKEKFDFNFSHQHDEGLYLRLEAGFGFAKITTPNDQSKMGFGFTHSTSIGGYLQKDFALHLSGFGLLSTETVRQGFGPGVTYYLTDSVFSSVAIGPTFGIDQEKGIQYSLSGEMSFGLMGWFSEETQLGIIAHMGGEAVDLDGKAPTQSGWRIGLRLGLSWH